MYPDFKELLSIFNAHRVKYLIVGGRKPIPFGLRRGSGFRSCFIL